MNQNQRNLRQAAMAEFLESLDALESTFAAPFQEETPPVSSREPINSASVQGTVDLNPADVNPLDEAVGDLESQIQE